ncbi:pimeloyl-ACP methyl ester carboxylesterase [Lentzea atacamensis]|uniref:Pimeloyl-ACP methyl ester carboxylesterase n=1 Tax=Lentzea atacamensis TaxID=531938 RepID=A0A316HQ88_9PSEU|nr:alpha/beta hydrolase [Lentzea atacamensis]PWK82755.1 pimeloyl-ACP methyl ester carboxylesterase [Lentzea atacamensis]
MDFEEIVIPTERLSFPALAAGEGPIVVCWHGFPDHPASFGPLAERLVAAGRRVVAPFLRGHHPSTFDQLPFADGLTLAADAAAVNAALSPEPLDVIGHDIGAGVAGRLAAGWPSRVRRVITMSVPPPATLRHIFDDPAQQQRFFYLFMFQVPGVAESLLNSTLIEYLWRTWSPGLPVPPHVLSMYEDPQLRANALKLYRANFDRSLHDPSLSSMAQATEKPAPIPMLVLAGAQDGCITPDNYTDAATGLAPGSRVEIVADAGHFLQLDRPDEVAALALDWLR